MTINACEINELFFYININMCIEKFSTAFARDERKNIYENDFYAILWMENFSPFAVEVIFPTTFFHDKDFAFF